MKEQPFVENDFNSFLKATAIVAKHFCAILKEKKGKNKSTAVWSWEQTVPNSFISTPQSLQNKPLENAF